MLRKSIAVVFTLTISTSTFIVSGVHVFCFSVDINNKEEPGGGETEK